MTEIQLLMILVFMYASAVFIANKENEIIASIYCFMGILLNLFLIFKSIGIIWS